MLAAGRGLRFGGEIPKPLLTLGGKPLVAHAVAAAVRSGLTPVVVVVSDERILTALPDVPATIVRNDAPEEGISSSLQVALRALEADLTVDPMVEGVVVGLADQPLVGADAYRRVAAALENGEQLAVATYGGVRANPVLISRAYWDEALALAGDVGARVLLRRHGAAEVPCDGTGEPADVDTPEDLIALEKVWKSQTASE